MFFRSSNVDVEQKIIAPVPWCEGMCEAGAGKIHRISGLNPEPANMAGGIPISQRLQHSLHRRYSVSAMNSGR